VTQESFREFCYDQYKLSLEQSNELYNRAAVLMTGLTVLGGATAALVNLSYLHLRFSGVEWLFMAYHVAGLAAVGTLLAAAAMLLAVIFPRSYDELATTDQWLKWRSDYSTALHKEGFAGKGGDVVLAQATHNDLVQMLTSAQRHNADVNVRRASCFKWSARLTVVHVTCLTCFALVRFILHWNLQS
jgi:hypothetical protein